MERGSHNRLSAIGKAITEIESNKANKTRYQFVDDQGKHRSREIKHAMKTQIKTQINSW